MIRDPPAPLGISLFRLWRLSDEADVANAARSHYRENLDDGAVGNAVVRSQVNPSAAPSIGERLEAGGELGQAEARLVDENSPRAIDRYREPALRLQRPGLRLWQCDVHTSLHHRSCDHEDDHAQPHHVYETHYIDLGVE